MIITCTFFIEKNIEYCEKKKIFYVMRKDIVMNKLYLIFDQIPSPESGGLVRMYLNICEYLKNDYEIEIISIYNCDNDNLKQFKDYNITIINKFNIDNRFFKIGQYLKNFEMKKVLKAIISALIFFLYIPICRQLLRKRFSKEKRIIVTSPAAAIFMSRKNRFILEVHTKYEYFWEGSFGARLQVKLMPKPSLILFRSKADAKKAENVGYNSNYIYNFAGAPLVPCYNYKKRKNNFIFIGRLDENKDPLHLIKIFEKLKKNGYFLHLDIYGSGDLETNLKEYIKNQDLKEIVSLKGFTTNKRIYENYTALLSASKNEGLPLTVLEAKRCGVPVIAFSWGDSTKEVITNGVNGFIVSNDEDFMEKIILLNEDQEVLKEKSENANISYRTFSPEHFKKKFINYIESY